MKPHKGSGWPHCLNWVCSFVVPQLAIADGQDHRHGKDRSKDEAEADATRTLMADLLLDNFRVHAGRPATPSFLRAHMWRYGFVEVPATASGHSEWLMSRRERSVVQVSDRDPRGTLKHSHRQKRNSPAQHHPQ